MAHRKLAIIRRRLFTALSVLSLLLFIATVVVGVRSYWRTDSLEHCRQHVATDGSFHHRDGGFRTARGELLFCLRATSLQPDQVRRWAPITKNPINWPLRYASSETVPGRHRWGSPDGCTQDVRFGSFQFGVTGPGPHRAPQFYKRGVFVVVPLWLVAILATILPAVVAHRWWRVRRRQPGLCAVCGYDLRATPDRCPECGTAVVTA